MECLVIIAISLLLEAAGAPLTPPVTPDPGPPPRVWITLDYPPSAKPLTNDEVQNFLFHIQQTGVS